MHEGDVCSTGRRAFLKRAGGLGIVAGAASLMGSTSVLAQQSSIRWSTIAFGPEALALWQQIADRAEQRVDGLQIDVEGTPFNDYWTKLQTQLASGGSADLVQMQSLRFPAYASRDVLMPLNQFIEADPDFDVEDFYPTIRTAFEHDGELQILPFDLGAFVTYINVDLFEAAGVPLPDPEVPMSWAQLAEIAKALTNPEAGTYGLVLAPTLESTLPWIWSNGGEAITADGKAVVADEKSLEAIKFLLDLVHEQKVVQPINDLANANVAPEAFVGGKVGMYFDGPWRFVSIRQNASFNWDVVPFPAGSAGSVPWVAGSGWGISANAPDPQAAWKALKELTSTESLKILDDAGRVFPSRKSTFALRTASDEAPKNAALVDKVLSGEIGAARPLVPPPTWNEIGQLAMQLMSPLFIEPGDVEGDLDILQSEMQSLLNR